MNREAKLNFRPLRGLSSKHLQTIAPKFIPCGKAPPTTQWLVDLTKGDSLSCEVSVPPQWTPQDRTVVLIHGLGGSHSSGYMVRLSRKFYQKGIKVVRVNLRGCGSGEGLAFSPSCTYAGNSEDILKVLEALKKESPQSENYVIGFSLGGNIILKLSGELGYKAKDLVKTFIAVCPPLDLAETVKSIQAKKHYIYHNYFFKRMLKISKSWLEQKVYSLYEFDDKITAPLWGYKNAEEYYNECSSIRFLPKIRHETHIVLAEDDPFVFLDVLDNIFQPDELQVWTSKHGGHMGFVGKNAKAQDVNWIDHLLINWIDGDFNTNKITNIL